MKRLIAWIKSLFKKEETYKGRISHYCCRDEDLPSLRKRKTKL